MASFEELTPREEEISCGDKTLNYGIVGCGRLGVLHSQILLSQWQEIVAVCDSSQDSLKYYFRNLSGMVIDGNQEFSERSGPEKLYKTLVPNGKTLSREKVAVYSNVDEMLSKHNNSNSKSENSNNDQQQQKIDAVIICSNTSNHTRDAEPFIRVGIKVYIAAPLASDLAEAFDFIKNLGSDATLMQVGLHRRFDAALSHSRQLLLEGRIGTVREVRVTLRTQFNPAHLSPDFETLGLLRDFGVEAVDTFMYLTGGSEMPSKISCMKFEAKDSASSLLSHCANNNKNPDSSRRKNSSASGGALNQIDTKSNTAFITFTTQTGVIGRIELSCGTCASGAVNTIEVIGSRGSISVDRFNGYPGPIHVELWKEDNTKCNLGSKTFDMNTRLRPKFATNEGDDTAPQCAENTFFEESLPRFQAAYRAAHIAFRHDVILKRSFKVTQMEALDAQVVVEAAVLSAEKGGAYIEVKKANSVDEYHNNCRKAGLC